MKQIVDWLPDHEGVSWDLWLSDSELGNEYWPGAAGNNTVRKFDVMINGSTYRSNEAANGRTDTDSTAPSAPANLSSSGHDSSSVDLDWDAATDSDGSVLDHYNVFVDGAKDHQVIAGNTSTTVPELSPDTNYDFSVTAVDSAGDESGPSNVVTVTTDSGSGGSDGTQSGSVYRIENVNSGKVLDVEGSATWDGANVLQWSWHSGDNQR